MRLSLNRFVFDFTDSIGVGSGDGDGVTSCACAVHPCKKIRASTRNLFFTSFYHDFAA